MGKSRLVKRKILGSKSRDFFYGLKEWFVSLVCPRLENFTNSLHGDSIYRLELSKGYTTIVTSKTKGVAKCNIYFAMFGLVKN